MRPSPQLIRAVRESRIEISREYSGLLSDLDVRKRFRNSFKNHPLRWIGGAAVAGILTSVFGTKRSKKTAKIATASPLEPTISGSATVSKVGWWTGALEVSKLLYPVLKPLVLEFASNAVQGALAKKTKPH